MKAGGFKNVEVDFVPKELEIESFNDLWSMFTVGAPPIQILFNSVGIEGKKRIHDALAEIVENRFGSDPITTTNTATLGCGIAA